MIILKRVNPNSLSNQEILDIIREEYYEIQPKGCHDFFKKRVKSPSLPYLKKRFGMTYNEILIEAGIPKEELNIVREKNWDKEFFIAQLKQLANELGHTPTSTEYKNYGYPLGKLTWLFGTYNQAIREAGLTPQIEFHKKIDKNELIKIYQEISRKVGEPATINDIVRFSKKYKLSVFLKVFGSINDLRKEAGYREIHKGPGKQFTKKQILEKLIIECKKKGRHLTTKEIDKNINLPCYETILRYFKADSLSDVWKAIDSILAKEHLEANRQRVNKRLRDASVKKVKKVGEFGEQRVAHQLSFLNQQQYKVYNDIKIRVGDLEQQIDHLVVGTNGIFHLETKNYTGDISIDRHGNWIQTKRETVQTIENPEGQVKRHEELISRILKEKYKITSILVFANPKCTLRNMDRTFLRVMKLEKVLPFIKGHETNCYLGTNEITEVCQLIEKHLVKAQETAI